MRPWTEWDLLGLMSCVALGQPGLLAMVVLPSSVQELLVNPCLLVVSMDAPNR
jgi:hypothetical protein